MLIDISPPLDDTIQVWPGDTPFVRTINRDMKDGANLTLSDIRTTVHVGASVDAPSHYSTSGADIAECSLDYYLGRCAVVHVDVARGDRITPPHIATKKFSAPRVLFRTGTFPDHRHFTNDFASLSTALIDELHQRGVMLVGIDTPSVDPFESQALEAHQACLRHEMAILEGVVLDGVAEGEYELIALPLRLRGSDGSPVRAVLRTL